MKNLILSSLMLVSAGACASADAPGDIDSGFRAGIAAGWTSGPYRNYTDSIILPAFSYEGNILYLRGEQAGIKLYRTQSDEITLSASLLPLRFKASDAGSHSMRALNDRKLSAMAGLGWTHTAEWGVATLTVRQRITGNKEGFTVGGSYGYPLHAGSLTVIPSVGAEYSNAELNDNYFGITQGESSRSGLRQYHAGSGTSPFVSLLAVYPLTQRIDITGGAKLTRLSDAVHNSPMADDRYTYTFITSLTYRF